jgi:dihydrofolate reductase
MRTLTYYIGMTIDGYIAGPAGELDHFFPVPDDVLAVIGADYSDTVPTHLRDQLAITGPGKRFDTVVMGRATYQPGLDAGVTSPYRHLRQYVVSSTLGGIDDPEVDLVTEDPLALVRRLKQEDGLGIWLCGGAQLAGPLLPEIDELVLKVYPVVAGAGIPLFTTTFAPTAFELRDARPLASGTVILTYTRKR